MAKPRLRMEEISKRFADVQALSAVDLDLYDSEILALLGENGSGKSSLMNVLSGLYSPDSGKIFIDEKEVEIQKPADAYALKIAMIHQHFKLVETLTAAENIILSDPENGLLNRREVEKRIADMAKFYGFDIDPKAKVYKMSISERQRLEIIKALYRGAEILVLDEPTAVLTPQESQRLFAILRKMREQGKSIIIITHKLDEVLSLSDRVLILRKGERVGCLETAKTNPRELGEALVGRRLDLEIKRPEIANKSDCLFVNKLTCLDELGREVLKKISFDVQKGEILGIAGIAKSGQKELCEAISGLHPVAGGSILLRQVRDGIEVDENLVGLSPREIIDRGISLAFVPEDRLGMGLAPSLDLIDNVSLKTYENKRGFLVDREEPKKIAAGLVEELDIATPSLETPIKSLSGGNVQKVLVGREIHSAPELLIVAYPVRGLDINSSLTIYKMLNQQKEKQVAIIFIGEDLDVLMSLSDRLMILANGQNMGIVDPRIYSKEAIGLMMTGKTLAEVDQLIADDAPELIEAKASFKHTGENIYAGGQDEQ
ncbi:MAG: ABC transporter ATP-binding protein [Eubacteriales bacterium]|nr:ABC transporter ATP-binding protein [Eubacteriales bacterium]